MVLLLRPFGCRVPKAWLSCSQSVVVVFPKLGCRVPKSSVVVFPKLGCRVPKAWLSCSQNLVVVFPKLGCRVPKDLDCLTFQSFHFFAYQKKVMPETCCAY